MTESSKRRKRRRYTSEERAAIFADAAKVGVAEASRRHGVPKSTVSNWRNRDARGAAAKPSNATASAGGVAASTMPTSDPSAEAAASAGKVVAVSNAPAVGAKSRQSPVARSYTPSEKAVVLEHAARHGVTAAAKKFGASRYSIYEWRRKVAKAAKGEGASPTSGLAPSEIEARRDREILGEWSKHPGLGPSQIRNQLRRRGVKVSVNTTRRVMEEAGYRPPKVERVPHDQRFEAVRPNHLWHLDFVHRHIHRAETNTLILIDDCSRFVTGVWIPS